MVAKQWLFEYMTDLTFEFRKQDSPERYQREARLREFCYNGLTKWHVPEIVAHCVAHCLAALLVLAIARALASSYSIFTRCLYKPPIFQHKPFESYSIAGRKNSTPEPDDPRSKWVGPIENHRNEKENIERHASDLDKKCLERLKESTRNEKRVNSPVWATEQLEGIYSSGAQPAVYIVDNTVRSRKDNTAADGRNRNEDPSILRGAIPLPVRDYGSVLLLSQNNQLGSSLQRSAKKSAGFDSNG
ncbi:uncharacterized protein EI90DRAFT_3015142 [Cantharellus anzutake]|uniref:uncharacterized protein n=1 Tax=Cantharellus anzutake TaxID=1750568 RepID=UPI00190651A8|nr:uncharacterized protein EI90DRAFT_3015142 [Cantharellus anzutake]KAF8334099.1 hypothetical protein EI90DRAFT_3015142 [Cantharellus anzutake]